MKKTLLFFCDALRNPIPQFVASHSKVEHPHYNHSVVVVPSVKLADRVESLNEVFLQDTYMT